VTDRSIETAAPLFRSVVLGIAGCSGSGKTTLATELARTLSGIHFPLDSYYRDLAHLPLSERVRQNFDDPALIEAPLLALHVSALARGEAIERPVYDFATYTRVLGRTETVRPAPFLIVEGLFTLVYPELLPLYHLRVYVDTPDDACFDRRLRRDVEERGARPNRCAGSTKKP
jgi:uridine kinase